MSDGTMKPLTFYLNDDFTICIGKAQRELKVPRLSWVAAGKVLDAIANVLANDNSAAIEGAGLASRASITMEKKAFEAHADYLKKIIPLLVRSKNYDVVKNLLFQISEGVVTDKETGEMQFNEAVAMLTYLLDANFAALKNLSASLQAISTSAK
jgi:hypothetical protein